MENQLEILKDIPPISSNKELILQGKEISEELKSKFLDAKLPIWDFGLSDMPEGEERDELLSKAPRFSTEFDVLLKEIIQRKKGENNDVVSQMSNLAREVIHNLDLNIDETFEILKFLESLKKVYDSSENETVKYYLNYLFIGINCGIREFEPVDKNKVDVPWSLDYLTFFADFLEGEKIEGKFVRNLEAILIQTFLNANKGKETLHTNFQDFDEEYLQVKNLLENIGVKIIPKSNYIIYSTIKDKVTLDNLGFPAFLTINQLDLNNPVICFYLSEHKNVSKKHEELAKFKSEFMQTVIHESLHVKASKARDLGEYRRDVIEMLTQTSTMLIFSEIQNSQGRKFEDFAIRDSIGYAHLVALAQCLNESSLIPYSKILELGIEQDIDGCISIYTQSSKDEKINLINVMDNNLYVNHQEAQKLIEDIQSDKEVSLGDIMDLQYNYASQVGVILSTNPRGLFSINQEVFFEKYPEYRGIDYTTFKNSPEAREKFLIAITTSNKSTRL